MVKIPAVYDDRHIRRLDTYIWFLSFSKLTDTMTLHCCIIYSQSFHSKVDVFPNLDDSEHVSMSSKSGCFVQSILGVESNMPEHA